MAKIVDCYTDDKSAWFELENGDKVYIIDRGGKSGFTYGLDLTKICPVCGLHKRESNQASVCYECYRVYREVKNRLTMNKSGAEQADGEKKEGLVIPPLDWEDKIRSMMNGG